MRFHLHNWRYHQLVLVRPGGAEIREGYILVAEKCSKCSRTRHVWRKLERL